MRNHAPLIAAAALAASCGKETRFIAAEMNGNADLRVVIAVATTGQKDIRALTRDEPFTFPLKDVFAASGRVRIYAFGFSTNDLAASFPALANKSADDIKTLLAPQFGTPKAGMYEYPAPLNIFRAEVDAESSGDVAYAPVDPSTIVSDTDAAFSFQLPAEIACAPGANRLRAFRNNDPSRVCLFDRTDDCTWMPDQSGCPHLTAIFGHTFPDDALIREAPPEGLVVDLEDNDLVCVEARDPTLSESRAWVCPGTMREEAVTIQSVPRGATDMPWAPVLERSFSVGAGGVVTHAARGAIFAFAENSLVRLRRFEARDGVLIDELSKVSGMTGALEIILPAQSVSEVALGNLRRLSANELTEDQVVLDGDRGTYVLIGDHGVSTSGNPLAFYRDPVPLGDSALPLVRRMGPVITGPGATIYAVIDNGVATLAVAGESVMISDETPSGRVSFSRDQQPNIVAVKRGAEERAIVWTDEGDVYAFDSDARVRIPRDMESPPCKIDGTIFTVLDGPRIVRRPTTNRFMLELIDLAPVEDGAACSEARLVTRYLVPPNSDAAMEEQIRVDTSSYVRLEDREYLKYSYGRYVGVLDLLTGLSQAIDIPHDAVDRSVLFENYSKPELWIMAGSFDSMTHQSIRIPTFEGQ